MRTDSECTRPVIDLKRLMIFREVVRRRSFSAAAEALNYSQPAVSHQVSRLELEIGARLLDRGRRDVFALTDAGTALLAHAEALLERAEEAENDLATIVGRRAEVRIGAFPTASATLFVEALAHVRQSWPDLPVRLIEGETQDTLESLRDRRTEIAVLFDDPDHPLEQDSAIHHRYVLNDPMLLALPVGHPSARHEKVRLADLSDDLWIQGAGQETASSLILAAACRASGFVPNTAFNSGNYGVVQELVSAGVGVALVPRIAIDPARENVVFRQLDPVSPYRRIALATRRRPGLSAGAAALLSSLETACERWQERLAAPLPV